LINISIMIKSYKIFSFFFFLLVPVFLSAQMEGGIVRGNVFDKESGDPIIFGTVRIEGTGLGANTDVDGFFSFTDVPVGKQKLIVSYVGYDSLVVDLEVEKAVIIYKRLYLSSSSIQLKTVNISSRREKARSDVEVSKLRVSPSQIRALPSTGGEADIAQYLPVLPGIISSGDQGGQLYIRGGSPVQNKILLDGMTIYNPFHSIGFFSVFETETIKSVDVLTAGFNADHGGRISAVVDIKTRDGNKKRFGGLVSASPFQAKALFEGPIVKLDEETGSSVSFLVTGKHSYLNESSKLLYGYATDTAFYSFAAADTSLSDLSDIGLPYQYTDLYGKLTISSGNGSKLNLFGFNFDDKFDLPGIATLGWNTTGFGASFNLIPPSSNVVMDGTVSFSNYDLNLQESDNAPRRSKVTAYSALLNFTYFGAQSQLDYGIEFSGFNTDFDFTNAVGLSFSQEDFTTEFAAYAKFKYKLGNLILEPGARLHFYASQAKLSAEPRLGLKYNITDFLRFKAGGGLYSQNLISTSNDLDVVNFFTAFLAGPEEALYKPGSNEQTDHRLQKSIHAVGGFEIDVGSQLEFNIEAYLKRFTQLININRNKLFASDPDFVTETGDAYGTDLSVRYETPSLYLWMTYSLGFVNRDDGEQVYPTVFDRRHNVNFLMSYSFGREKNLEAALRWNLGSGFPFTQTQGFYQNVNYQNPFFTDILTGNHDLGVILSDERNGGRLSYYHRLDASLKYILKFSRYSMLETTLSVTNVYNRENIFYVDRITNTKVNQLPILPSLGMVFKF